jgi:hypothetical protein
MTLERGRPRDESMNGGTQSTDMSLIHRRYSAPVASPDRSVKRQALRLLTFATIRVDCNSQFGSALRAFASRIDCYSPLVVPIPRDDRDRRARDAECDPVEDTRQPGSAHQVFRTKRNRLIDERLL